MKNIYRFFKFLILGILFSGFSIAQDYSNGIFILNEGQFGTSNASLSFLSADGVLENDVYSNENPGLSLGDLAQGIGINGDNIYFVMNGSNKVIVANRITLQYTETISTDITSPRHIAFHDGKGYVTCWGDPGDPETSYVAVIDLETNEVESTIAVAEGPERIINKDGKLYVAHKGGYGFGNSISVIDAATEQVEVIEVGDVPDTMQIIGDKLYVICSGVPAWSGNETEAGIYEIDFLTNTVSSQFNFEMGEHPGFLAVDDALLYYVLNSGVYKIDFSETTPEPTLVVQTTTAIPYGFNIIDDKIYVADAVDYIANGSAFVYSIDGVLENTHTVGLIPNGFYKSEGEMGTIDQTFSQISIYPNPTSHEFYIDGKNISNVEIFDLTGKLVKSTQNLTSGINIQDLAKGIYIVKIQSGNNTITKKIIIK